MAAVTRPETDLRPRTTLARRGATTAVAALVALGALAGCSGSGGDSAKGPATISPETTVGSDGTFSCDSVEPGIVVDRTKAVVHFDTESMCPGWVTVEQGTQVTFANDGSAPYTVVVTATQLPGSAEVARFTIPAGGTQPLDTLDVGMMGFSTDALPGFRGTVEVVGPNGEMQH